MKYILSALILFIAWPSLAYAKGDLVTLTNEFRARQGLATLQVDSRLNEIAQRRAEYILNTQKFSHEGWTEFYGNQGFCYVGENLARYYKRDKQIMRGWKKSSSHYENLVRSYQYVGLAKVKGVMEGHKTEVVVMTFGIKCE